ncbi:MAG: hypothetical protein IE931_11245 [Sphingobacteriales bacterium]|nr:hypothetical protein [Sphingobacteriales bacterium]
MKIYYSAVLSFFFLILMSACHQSNSKNEQLKDSLMASNLSDSSILVYASGIEKLSAALQKEESPVYNKGDYTFYAEIFKKGDQPVIYHEFDDAGDFGYTDKKYYLDKGDLILYTEKTKQVLAGAKPSFTFTQKRIYYRNGVFLKAEERNAAGDSLLLRTPFSVLDENLVDKNKQFDFQALQDAVHQTGDYNLTFTMIDSTKSKKLFLIMGNGNATCTAKYLVSQPDSLINNLLSNPSAYKNKKLQISFTRQGTDMIYKSGSLPF